MAGGGRCAGERIPRTRSLDHGAGSARYDEAFGVVREIRALRVAHRQQPAFGAEAIRKTYRAKRNFIKLLELDA